MILHSSSAPAREARRLTATPFRGAPSLQRKCASGGIAGRESKYESCWEKPETGILQRKATDVFSSGTRSQEIPPIVHEALRSPGQPLDTATRAFMEPRFGHDFSRVRVHADSHAVKSAHAVNAHAYTVGRDIVFGAEAPTLATEHGRRLLGHELAHTIQQERGSGSPPSPDPNGIFESSAETAGRDIASGRAVSGALPACGVGLSRDEASDRAKAVAEANAYLASAAKEEDEEDEPAPRKPKAPSRFAPGGFTDNEAKKLEKEATDRTKLMNMALTLAERQAKRHEFWDSNPQYTSEDAREAFKLDLYWDPAQDGYVRQRYVDDQEAIVEADPDAKSLFRSHLWDLTENKPVEKSRFKKVMDVACKYTEPCSSTMDQIHKDEDSGMSRLEATNRGILRTLTFGATALIPGGPQGPIAIGPKSTPSGGVRYDIPEGMPGEFGAPSETPAPTGSPKPTVSAPPAPPTGPVEVTPATVRTAYKANPYSVKKSLGNDWHQQKWMEDGAPEGSKAPIAFRTKDGAIRVNEERWLAVGELSEINSPADLAPVRPPPARPAQTPAVDPLARTGAAPADPLAQTGQAGNPPARSGAVDPMAQTGAPTPPAPAGNIMARQTQNTPPPQPKASPPPAPSGPRGYTPVQPSVVVEAYRINPDVLSVSHSTNFHNMVWRHGGGTGDAPVAFRVGNQIRVNMELWPAGQRGLIGQGMTLTP